MKSKYFRVICSNNGEKINRISKKFLNVKDAFLAASKIAPKMNLNNNSSEIKIIEYNKKTMRKIIATVSFGNWWPIPY